MTKEKLVFKDQQDLTDTETRKKAEREAILLTLIETGKGILGFLDKKLMTNQRRTGTGLIILGVAMLFFGGSLFSYQGPRLNPIISETGMISFMLWLPTIIAGIILVSRRRN